MKSRDRDWWLNPFGTLSLSFSFIPLGIPLLFLSRHSFRYPADRTPEDAAPDQLVLGNVLSTGIQFVPSERVCERVSFEVRSGFAWFLSKFRVLLEFLQENVQCVHPVCSVQSAQCSTARREESALNLESERVFSQIRVKLKVSRFESVCSKLE